ncbi:MAG: site-specific integrase [Acidobacteria bacterium]|nr:site-specific integrase [Acidobacteriota bacterium]
MRYRDPAGQERARSFLKKVDANRFAVTVEADILRGEWTDPRLSKTTVAEWSERWYRTKSSLKPKTLVGYDSNLRVHVLSAFGDYELRHIDRMAVEEWVADLQASGLGPSAIRQARQVLNSIMKLAVEAGYLLVNPVTGVKAPRQNDREMLFLSAEEVERLAAAIQPPYATLVYLLAYGGLRWGEAVAVRRKRCQLLRSRVEVAESLTEARGRLEFGTTKTHQRRMVVIPGFLRELLAAHLAAKVSDDSEALIFTSLEGQPLRNSNFRRRVWHRAIADAGLEEGLRIHDLRHTCASLLIAQGAHPKAIQVHLGHSSISVTMDRYGHLFPSDMEALAADLDAVRSRALADQMRTKEGSEVIELGAR